MLHALPLLVLTCQQLLSGAAVAKPQVAPADGTPLNITSIATNDKKESVLECWQLAAPLKVSSTAGAAGSDFAMLGNLTKTSFGVVPGKFNGGLHTAPAAQYVAFVSGQAFISLPNSSQTATVYGGKHGLIFAADTPDKSDIGHYTRYPTEDNTVAFQLPTAGGVIPDHKVLHAGACCENTEQTF